MDCRRLYNLVKYLPPDAALWRVQGAIDVHPQSSDELFSPGRTSDPEVVKAFFNQHIAT